MEPTPVRARGTRTDEGWLLLRDPGSTYRDGAEGELVEILRAATDLRSQSDELVSRADGWAQTYHLAPSRANIVRGLRFPEGAKVLEIGAGCGAVTRYLGETAAAVDALEPVPARARVIVERCRDLSNVAVLVGEIDDVPREAVYDVVVVIGVLEYVGSGAADHEPYVRFLRAVHDRLAPGGTLVLAIENSLGVKYLAGAPEDHTNRPFDSLESYPYGSGARTFSRRVLEEMFVEAGFQPRTLAAFPDYKMTRTVMDVAGMTGPAAALAHQLPTFPSPDHLTERVRLADEGLLWRELCEAGLGPDTANSFLVVAGKGGPSPVWVSGRLASVHSLGRREEFRMTTRVDDVGGTVRVSRTPVAPQPPGGDLAVVASVEELVDGTDLVGWAAVADDAQIGAALRTWVDLVRDPARGEVSFDFVPHNMIRRADGTLVAIDQEWAPSSLVDEPHLLRRGILWFAARLAAVTAPSRWPGLATVGDLVGHLAGLAGVDLGPESLAELLSREASIQAAVVHPTAGLSADEWVAARRADLAQVVSTRLEDSRLGVRAPDRLRELADRAAELSRRLDETTARADSLETVVAEQADVVERAAVAVRERTALEQRATSAELAVAQVHASRSWRAIQKYYSTVERLAPQGSRRRRLHGAGLRLAARPARAALRLRRAARGQVGDRPHRATAPAELATSTTPVVSIVVPVHGKWRVTAQCLRSFVDHPPSVPYEIVVVDDASGDDTRRRLAAVRGVRVVALDQNRGFIGATNAGIEASRGEYVVMLNNDTQITDGWLEALLDTVREPGVGLVGSKLVYPDGRLQEAGGIIFDDATGWNYGRFDDPALQRYNVRRDVDYCSGAAIIIRRDLLAELGNLDERFAPAYFDDVDLAFAVRERGLRVVYEPRAVVVHHEGISHGTDTTSGVKAYQEINRATFVEKWAHRLRDHYPQVESLVQEAARRHDGAGTVVVIDHHVPRPDEDSGSVRMFGLLTTLRDLGWRVVFVPDNRDAGDVWGERLLAEGIEVFCGPEPTEQFLASIRGRVRAVIAARVTVAWPYVAMVRRTLPGVRLIFDTVDLHHVRERREGELADDAALIARSEETRKLELGLIEAADSTLVVSPFEQELLARETPGAVVSIVPNVHATQQEGPGPSGRSGLVFVGSFAHPPNGDAIRWFVDEVLPLVRAEVPDVTVRVVGRGGSEAMEGRQVAGVDVAGWLPSLDPVYATARVAIAPLRYGAGIKGKVGEALSHGVPVVATTVAAEGMHLVHGASGWIGDDPQTFADGVVALLRDDELWARVSAAGRDLVEESLGQARFTQLVRTALEDAGVGTGTDRPSRS